MNPFRDSMKPSKFLSDAGLNLDRHGWIINGAFVSRLQMDYDDRVYQRGRNYTPPLALPGVSRWSIPGDIIDTYDADFEIWSILYLDDRRFVIEAMLDVVHADLSFTSEPKTNFLLNF